VALRTGEPAPASRTIARSALEDPGPRRRLVLVVNPHAAGTRTGLGRLVAAALASRFDVEAIVTDAPGHATGIAGAAARDGVDAVVTLGGDGTVNEAANGLVGTGIALHPLPGGSQNVYAKLLGVPQDLVDAAEHLLARADDWRPRPVDAGRVNGRVFTFSAGAGLDAAVVERVDARPARKARWRELAYIQSAAGVFLRDYAVRAPKLVVGVPGAEPVEAVTVLIQNAERYTFAGRRPIEVCRDVTLDSGTLSAAALRRTGPIDLVTMASRLWFERLEATGHRHATSLTGLDELTVRRADGTPVVVQVDGEALAPAPEARFDVLPGALTVLA
jgi:diacylglycerol kinase family enzyme